VGGGDSDIFLKAGEGGRVAIHINKRERKGGGVVAITLIHKVPILLTIERKTQGIQISKCVYAWGGLAPP